MAQSRMTITEALAEVRTIVKRIAAKEAFIGQNFGRHNQQLDPHEAEGGSEKLVREAMQSRKDLQDRWIAIRSAIQKSNLKTKLTIEGHERTVAEWLVWRREIERDSLTFLRNLVGNIHQNRKKIRDATPDGIDGDLKVHLSEANLAEAIEQHEIVVGQLDGQLTLMNSTTFINI